MVNTTNKGLNITSKTESACPQFFLLLLSSDQQCASADTHEASTHQIPCKTHTCLGNFTAVMILVLCHHKYKD